MTGQRFSGDALGYWQGTVESGELDQAADWEDGTPLVTIQLSQADLEILEVALKRQFTAMKKNRTGVMHAVKAVRKALQR